MFLEEKSHTPTSRLWQNSSMPSDGATTRLSGRPYQLQAIDQTCQALSKHSKVVLVAATASGKSVIIALLVARFLARFPAGRVLVLCHQSEILSQNESKLHAAGVESVGVNCAALRRRDSDHQVILASRDTLGRDPLLCGAFDLVIVDEAHLVSPSKESRYQKIFTAVAPRFVVGLTGTPWRLDNGLIYGKRKFFEKATGNITIDVLVKGGFLSPYRFPQLESHIDTSQVKTKGADFDEASLSAVSSTEAVVARCLDTWESQGEGRRVSLFFCCSLAHAAMVTSMLEDRGVVTGYLDGKTKQADREALLDGAKRGAFRAVVNVGVLTTGVDIPIIDCVVMLRATQSAALFVQCIGRGLRRFEGKDDCLVLDMAGNFERFESLDSPFIPQTTGAKKDKDAMRQALGEYGMTLELDGGEVPGKECPECGNMVFIATRVCPQCKHVFINHSDKAHAGNIGGTARVDVFRVTWAYSQTKRGKTCVIVSYATKRRVYREWLNIGEENEWIRRQAQTKLAWVQKHAQSIRAVEVKGLESKYPKLTPLLEA